MKRIFVMIIMLIITLTNSYGETKKYTESKGKDCLGYWRKVHEDYSQTNNGKDDIRVKWAYEIFERVKQVADKTSSRPPQLLIINTKIKIFAQSLPDGGIIINPRTLDICYGDKKPKPEPGNHRLAFILGHELAHLGNNDFIHREIHHTLEKSNENRTKKKVIQFFDSSRQKLSRENIQKEFIADRYGAIYAAMSGYEVGKIFGGSDDFLSHWAKQTMGNRFKGTESHPAMVERIQLIATLIEEVERQLELFKTGVLLYHIESYDAAASAFKEFSKLYPAREVFNNIGACYFNLAMRRIRRDYGDDFLRFRLSTTIDYNTTAEKMLSRGDGHYLRDKYISRYIDKAVEFFQRAVQKNTHHLISHYNLSAALILRKDYHGAIAVCGKVLKHHPQDVKVLNNLAITHYYYREELSRTAIEDLKKCLRLEPDNIEVLYNLASFIENKYNPSKARPYWESYLSKCAHTPSIPRDNFYSYIYEKIKKKRFRLGTCPPPVPSITGNVQLTHDLSYIEKKCPNNHIIPFELFKKRTDGKNIKYLNLRVAINDNWKVVLLDEMIALIEKEFRAENRTDAADVIRKLGSPMRIVHHSSGNFYIYKGFSFREIYGKVHSYIWFNEGY